ncbi:hypothetical protein K488DRAFT_89236 [Vararia minispora EC-137]|uniref:Uncharacterized protein n=1 Tax=Vararia minispora EC-137 TaxID=1314806 RepID=A0ACB8QCD9_9AGAM|nr:hypothetical protein K488DRAFT_89236 [Vararia minispora EC-137]
MATGVQAPDLHLTLGPLLLGLVADAVYVLNIFNAYLYWQSDAAKDARRTNWLVTILCILDTFQLFLVIHAAWHFFVNNFGNYVALEVTSWSLDLEVAPTLVIAIAQVCIGLYMCAMAFILRRFDDLPKYLVLFLLQLALSIAEDVLISGSLIYYLHYSRSGISKTDSMIDKLITWIANTACLAAVCELGQLIVLAALPHTLLFMPFHLVVAKLYTNSMLAMLNGREVLRQASQPSAWDASAPPGPTRPQNSIIRFGRAGPQDSTASYAHPVELRLSTHHRRPFPQHNSPDGQDIGVWQAFPSGKDSIQDAADDKHSKDPVKQKSVVDLAPASV